MSPASEPIDWDEHTFAAALHRVAADGVIEAPGVRLDTDRLTQLLAAAPKDPERPGRSKVRTADFAGAMFSGRATFSGATFSGAVDFSGATFKGDAAFSRATFSGATFSGAVDFSEATFNGDAAFGQATFSRPADFVGAHFGGQVSFVGATFGGSARFGEATFEGDAGFVRATFKGDAGFVRATFKGDASFVGVTFTGAAFFGPTAFMGDTGFGGATFSRTAQFVAATFDGDTSFVGATFAGDTSFARTAFGGGAEFDQAIFGADVALSRATFSNARQFGPLLVCGRLKLDRAWFAQPVRIEVSARALLCDWAVFGGGADVFARWSDLSFEDVNFADVSLVSELSAQHSWDAKVALRSQPAPPDDPGAWRQRLQELPEDAPPRVVSLRRAKVARLTLSGMDLRACRFAGAHGLDELKLERVGFAYPPKGWRWVRQWRRLRWTRRQTVAEERHWRQTYDHGWGWYDASVRAPTWLADASQPPSAEQVAGIYRALRKGREDSKDEPGAADFYYGEMEMRRHGAVLDGRPVVSILWLYWLVCGYGLRASRALLALAITIGLGALLLHGWGFDAGEQPKEGSLLFASESAISLLRQPEAQGLTVSGHVIQIALRLAGPLFFGLALLSLRSRVKR